MTTFVGIARHIPQFSILLETLSYIDANIEGSNLVATLNDRHQSLTVFAPTNNAFGQLAADLGFAGNPHDAAAVTAFLVGNVDVATLNAVVTYHVAGTALSAHQIANAGAVETLQGGSIGAGSLPNLVDAEPDLADPRLIATDIHVANGVLHVIDRVLLPIDLPGNTPAPAEPTIAAIAIEDPNFSILVDTLQFIDANLADSDLVGTLSDANGDFTVFAPTNAAFGQLAVDLGFDGDAADAAAVTAFLTENVPVETLNAVVTYHVAGGALTLADIAASGTVETVQGGTITAGPDGTLVDLEPDLADPTLIATDLPAANGIVHVIDRVLLPVDLPGNSPAPVEPTIVDIALGDTNFSILVAALQFIDGNLEGSDLVGTLADAGGDFTVFAPTNAAFGQLAVDLGFAGDASDTAAVTTFLVENVDVETLNAVVTYHVAGGTLLAADIAAAGTVQTLQGGEIGAGELPTLSDQEPDLIDPSLIATDIPAANGVVHVIDRVLLPVDLADNDAPSITDIVAASGEGFDDNNADFDILLEAVKTAGLAETLASADVDLTVFAPNDDAFVKLAQDIGFDGSDEGDAWTYLVDALTVVSKGDPVSLLTDVLTYHVAGTSLQASQVLGLDNITTLQGGTVAVADAALIDNDPETFDANLIATDIQANNGIVHVIDEVLIPTDLLAGNNTDLEIGTDGRDYIHTGRGDDFVNGKGGKDFILLGSGDDVGFGGDGRDLISGWRGDDHIDGGGDSDRLYGGKGDDMVSGGAGRDMIFGGRGDDIINGGTEDDMLFGGRGADTFIFVEGDGMDKIRDFNHRQDQIDLSAYGFDGIDDLGISTSGHSTHIDLGNDDGITLAWVNAGNLTEDNFIF
ncbi:fasciclin domain-containing protein [Yoonia sp. SS1-5]|uniref:Fasciclin domain-containing protein n=1 Tax=Yoonia rhodophyticola TaxID=3137370 RepID=A0AAN0NJF6_9RHOB